MLHLVKKQAMCYFLYPKKQVYKVIMKTNLIANILKFNILYATDKKQHHDHTKPVRPKRNPSDH